MNNDKKKILPLDRYVSRSFDPRNKKGKRHPLKSILGLLVVGLMCGHKGYTSIATWARTQKVMAALRNTALSVFRFTGATRIADMMKYYASNSKLGVNIIK